MPRIPCVSAGKESSCNVGGLGSIPGLGRSPGGGKDYPFQYSGLENSTGCIVHGVKKSWTRLSDFYFPGRAVVSDLSPLWNWLGLVLRGRVERQQVSGQLLHGGTPM